MTDRNDERDLERLVRAGFERGAAGVDPDAPVLERARAAARRRHGAKVVGAAVVAVAAVALTGVVLDRSLTNDGDEPPSADLPSETTAPVTSWRTEYWRDLQVDVPADWGYGGSPIASEDSHDLACFPTAMVSAAGEKLRRDDPTMPYVGRPIALTDVCVVYPFLEDGPDDGPPEAPYLWFDAPIDAGTERLGDGWVQETVEVMGSSLTVATQDPMLRRQILDSANGGETCFSEVSIDGALPGGDPDPDAGPATSMVICAYRSETSGGVEARLAYAARLGEAATTRYVASLAGAGAPRDQCPTIDYSESEWVVLELRDAEDRLAARHVIHFACPSIDQDARTLPGILETIPLTPERVRPWAVGGIPAVIYGPSGGKGAMLDSFIGPQG